MMLKCPGQGPHFDNHYSRTCHIHLPVSSAAPHTRPGQMPENENEYITKREGKRINLSLGLLCPFLGPLTMEPGVYITAFEPQCPEI